MKKRLLLLLFAALSILPAFAADFVVDGISYMTSSDGRCSVVSSSPKYSGDIVIPESVTYEGTTYSVTSIGYEAFKGCSVTSVIIPNSVTYIGNYAFSSCRMTSVTIGNSVTEIGYAAFEGCTKLTSINLPNSVETIGDRAFESCGALTSFIIPPLLRLLRRLLSTNATACKESPIPIHCGMLPVPE